MKRFQVLVASILVVGVFGVRACSRDDDASTTTTTSAATPAYANATLVTPAGASLRRQAVDTDVYHPERQFVSSDNATTTTTPTAPRVTAAEASATADVTRTAQRKEEAFTAPSPVGPGGFAAVPLDTAGAFVPGPLDPARGLGPARVDPSSAFTAAPLDTSFRSSGVFDNDPTSGAMRSSGTSNPSTTSGAAPRR